MGNINSPCQSICILDETDDGTDYCIGCFRTVSEIQNWWDLPEEVQQEIIDDLPNREDTM